eukprot:1947741-Ditylum_brightwellii.AAC.1
MLDCDTQEMWDSTNCVATAVITHEPRQQSELDKEPTHADQNHTRILCHLGNRCTFSIADHLKVLIEMQ